MRPGFRRSAPLPVLALLGLSFPVASPAAALPPVHVVISALEGGLPAVTTGELKSFVVEKPVDWTTKPGHVDPPGQEYGEPEPTLLSATLSFVSDDPDVDVIQLVGPLEQMTVPNQDLGRPPMVEFTLGRFAFKGVIDSLAIKYTAIEADGSKAKAVVDLKIRKASSASSGIMNP